VSELVTDSAKYGKGKITVRFETPSPHSHLLSVTDEGPGLPADFKLQDSKGMGMRIIQALVKPIKGALFIAGRGNGSRAHLAISFRSPETD
jgi:two-component sensor histidine kinase